MKKVYILKSRYVDSVTLMGVAEKITKHKGVFGAESGMGTRANTELLTSLGYPVPEDVTPNDLIIAVSAETEGLCQEGYEAAVASLDHRGGNARQTYHDLIELPAGQYNLAQISLPGEYAAVEIKKALRLGMDVFAFSDNVSLEEELACKQLGRELGKLVMGPDAGVGLIGGVALAAGSIVRPGGVGIVAASGSGAQEVACLLEQIGAGVSSIIGTGGRDLSPQIGGITMRMGMERLEKDEDTQVICLVSKLADTRVMAEMLTQADMLTKPVVAIFLGADEALYEGHRVWGVQTLQEAAQACYALLTGSEKRIGRTEDTLRQVAKAQVKRIAPSRRYLRGLYCGGTFAEEAMILFTQDTPGVQLYSNLHTRYARAMASVQRSEQNTILDLGAEDFTAEAPHPVFDPALRLRRLEAELKDSEVAVVVLDFITGPGVHPDPITPFVPLIQRHPEVVFVTAICGAQGDPQDIEAAKTMLVGAGAFVAVSNAEGARFAALMMDEIDRRQQ